VDRLWTFHLRPEHQLVHLFLGKFGVALHLPTTGSQPSHGGPSQSNAASLWCSSSFSLFLPYVPLVSTRFPSLVPLCPPWAHVWHSASAHDYHIATIQAP
jgi:hypothetical protein